MQISLVHFWVSYMCKSNLTCHCLWHRIYPLQDAAKQCVHSDSLTINWTFVLLPTDSAIDTQKPDNDPTFVRLRNPSTGISVYCYTSFNHPEVYELSVCPAVSPEAENNQFAIIEDSKNQHIYIWDTVIRKFYASIKALEKILSGSFVLCLHIWYAAICQRQWGCG